jgi:hypothetical protein
LDHRAVEVGSHERQQQSDTSPAAVTTHESFHRPGEGGRGEIGEVDTDTDSGRLDDLVALVLCHVVFERAN